jgi:gliding motility-associated-like protein
VVCEPDERVLNPGNFNAYLWHDGSTNTQFQVNTAGLFWVEVSDANGCRFRDSIQIAAYHPQVPAIDLGPDIFWCDSVVALALGVPPDFNAPLWSTGQNSDSITVQTEGMYWVRVETWCNLIGTDTIQLAWAQSASPPLPADTTVCQAVVLNGGAAYVQWLWEDGSSQQFRNVTEPGTYTLQATTAEGCITYDTIAVQVEPLASKIEIPNAFSPNGDGQNDAFAWLLEHIDAMEMTVYNRWGVLQYQTSLMDGFWDGGGLPDGTYYYRARYHETCSNTWNERHGWLELMR